MRVLEVPSIKRDGAEASVDRVGGASVSSIVLAVEFEGTDGTIMLGRFDIPDGSLHYQASELSNQAFQTSLELIGCSGRDL